MEPSGTRQNLPEHSGTRWNIPEPDGNFQNIPEPAGQNMAEPDGIWWGILRTAGPILDLIASAPPPIFRCDLQLLFSEVFTETHPRPCRGPPGPTFARHRRTRGRARSGPGQEHSPRKVAYVGRISAPGVVRFGRDGLTNKQTNRHCRLFIRWQKPSHLIKKTC